MKNLIQKLITIMSRTTTTNNCVKQSDEVVSNYGYQWGECRKIDGLKYSCTLKTIHPFAPAEGRSEIVDIDLMVKPVGVNAEFLERHFALTKRSFIGKEYRQWLAIAPNATLLNYQPKELV